MSLLLALAGAMVLSMAACSASPNARPSYIGKTVMVGVVLVNHEGAVIKRVQAHGVIKAIEDDAGIVLTLADPAKPFLLPPLLESLRAVPPGTYRERSTGQLVVNPDYATVWQAEADADVAPGVLDWTRGMTWSRPLTFDFPGDNWAAEHAH